MRLDKAKNFITNTGCSTSCSSNTFPTIRCSCGNYAAQDDIKASQKKLKEQAIKIRDIKKYIKIAQKATKYSDMYICLSNMLRFLGERGKTNKLVCKGK